MSPADEAHQKIIELFRRGEVDRGLVLLIETHKRFIFFQVRKRLCQTDFLAINEAVSDVIGSLMKSTRKKL